MQYVLKIDGKYICPYCGGEAKYKGARERDDHGNEVDMYKCVDCGCLSRD